MYHKSKLTMMYNELVFYSTYKQVLPALLFQESPCIDLIRTVKVLAVKLKPEQFLCRSESEVDTAFFSDDRTSNRNPGFCLARDSDYVLEMMYFIWRYIAQFGMSIRKI